MGGAGERAAYARACLVFDASDRHLDSRLACARLNEGRSSGPWIALDCAILVFFFSVEAPPLGT